MSKAVVLSDVHIGNNSVTNWYQKKYHEPYLVKALEWVQSNADSISDLVLLGDLVDFWTYSPEVIPPTMTDIIDANPNVLGANGALAKAAMAIRAGNGQVTLMPGNHDITLTAADASSLSNAIGVDVTFQDSEHLELAGQSRKKTWFVHGHYFTMFNAPGPTTPLTPTPVGHFVTRIIAWKMVHKVLTPGQTVADLHLWGQPSPDFSTVIDAVRKGGVNIAAVLLGLFADDAGCPDSTHVKLPGGSTVVTIGDAKAIYADLLPFWLRRWPPLDVVRAAMADYTGDVYMAWFAQWLALNNGVDLVIAGHTHQPIGGLTASPVAYVNNGYECAAIPDLNSGAAAFTFTVVDLETATAVMHKVAPGGHGGYAVSDFHAPRSGVVESHFYDMSCYVRLTNRVGQQVTSDPVAPPGHGRWVIEPPATLANGQTGWIWLQDNPGAIGSLGSFSYNQRPAFTDRSFRYDVACPTGAADNIAGGPGADFVARSGDSGKSWLPWQARGKVPLKGYPLQIEFTLDARDIDPDFAGTCGQNSFAVSALGLQPGFPMKLNGSTVLSGCVQGNDGACVYSIRLDRGSYIGGIYQYRLSIDGQGPKGAGSGSFYLAFTDQTGDVYRKSFFWSYRQTLTLDYSSDSPTIVKLQWNNKAI